MVILCLRDVSAMAILCLRDGIDMVILCLRDVSDMVIFVNVNLLLTLTVLLFIRSYLVSVSYKARPMS